MNVRTNERMNEEETNRHCGRKDVLFWLYTVQYITSIFWNTSKLKLIFLTILQEPTDVTFEKEQLSYQIYIMHFELFWVLV